LSFLRREEAIFMPPRWRLNAARVLVLKQAAGTKRCSGRAGFLT
jgi:hypothetical protein